MSAMRDLFAAEGANTPIRFIIFASYGNDSCALIQWAYEMELDGVVVVYTDTGWAANGWRDRVEKMEAWVRSLGFRTDRTSSIGFMGLAEEKSGFPTQRYQWCSYRLKIEPGIRWLTEKDPDRRAVCLVGVRQEESEDRASFPVWLAKSGNHGDRFMLAPFAEKTAEERDAYLRRAGIEPLPHRSRECKCINSNKTDMRFFTEDDIAEIEAAEVAIGRPLFRPHRHMGASGIREVIKWAHSERGSYVPPVQPEPDPNDDLPDEDLFGCSKEWCGS